ncbi:MAG TPA: S8 family serine peptidase [Pyrinomonadaceae bacterium]|nr:S8 family serine peptidase [Pyrinomonadaceae bacterium]
MTRKTPSSLATWLVLLSLFSSMLVGGGRVSAQSGEAARQYPQLARYATDLTRLAREGRIEPAAPGREEEALKAVEILARASGNNPVLLAEQSFDAKAVAGVVALKVAAGEVPARLRGARVYSLSRDALLAGAQNTDEFVARLRAVVEEAAGADERIILFVEEFQHFAGTYTERAASEAVRAAVEGGRLRVIGATTPVAYAQHIAKDAALARLFRPLRLAVEGEDEAAAREDEVARAASDFVGDKLSPDLREMLKKGSRAKGERVKVILQADDVNDSELRSQLRRDGARVVETLEGLGALEVELSASAAERLAAGGRARHLSLDRKVAFLGHVEATTGAETMRAQGGQGSLDGAGIGVAVLDSGLFREHDSMDNVKLERDFTGENTKLDWYGHGTHVTGLLANKDNFDGNYLGIAPKVDIINLRVLDKHGVGRASWVLKALNWILEPTDPNKPAGEKNYEKYRIRVVNLSLGAPAIESYRNDPLCRAVRAIVDKGIVVVAAAGNNGKDNAGREVYGLIHSPGNEPSAITVGATNTFGTDARGDDQIASFSSRGPTRGFWTDAEGVRHYDNHIKPELVAPGNKLIAAEAVVRTKIDGTDVILPNHLIESHPELRAVNNNDYKKRMMRLSGTSMATPIVSGAAALLLQANPKLTPNMVKMILMYTAQPLAGYNMLQQGAGQLNIEGAMRVARRVRTDLGPDVPQGTSLLTSGALPAPQTTLAGHSFPWAQGIILRYHYATGTNLIAQYQTVYGLGMVLGSGILMSDAILMSDGILMGDGILLGDGILMSDGMVLGSGTLFLPSGILMSDGMVLGDGILMSDAAVGAMSAMIGGDETPAMK